MFKTTSTKARRAKRSAHKLPLRDRRAMARKTKVVAPETKSVDAKVKTKAPKTGEVKTKKPVIKTRKRDVAKFTDKMTVNVINAAAKFRAGSNKAKMLALFKTGMTVRTWRNRVIKNGLGTDGWGHLSFFVQNGVVSVADLSGK